MIFPKKNELWKMCAESKEEIDSWLNLYHVMYALSALATQFQKYCEFNLRIRGFSTTKKKLKN